MAVSMNERIRLLALQMGHVATIGNWGRVEWADNIYPQLGDKMYAAIDLERFAELIVRECLEACSRANEIRHFVPPTQEQVVLSCMREIETTFRS